MLKTLARWRREYLVRRHAIPDALWQRVTAELDLLRTLSPPELTRLRELATLFLHQKRFAGTHGFVVDAHMKVSIAAQACLLVLNLGLEYFRGWRGVLIYEGGFLARHHYEDEYGVVHEVEDALDGETWGQGPVILSWAEIAPDREQDAADAPSNVVLHEFAHKLDYLSGDANGCPPLHRDVRPARWKAAFLDAYEQLCALVDSDAATPIDPYAAESPAELFAVATESFFLEPAHLRRALPEVYRQLSVFYRQDPETRMRRAPDPAQGISPMS